MSSRRDERIPLGNTIRKERKCLDFIKPYWNLVVLLIIILVWIPPAFLLSGVIMSYYGDVLLTQNESIPINFITERTKSAEYFRIPSEKCGKRIINYHKDLFPNITISKVREVTHLIFAFAGMNGNGDIGFYDDEYEWKFLDMKSTARIVSSKIKVMISIGGAGRSRYFERIFEDSTKRKHFIDSIAFFLFNHKIDGVDFFWIWPLQHHCENLVIFLRELRNHLADVERYEKRTEPYIISLVWPRMISHMESLTCLNDILEYVDFINVITYDYFGPNWWPETGPSAPLYSGPKGKDFGNVDSTMKYLACHTKKPSKVNLGLQFNILQWKNVKEAIDPSDEMWRRAEIIDGQVERGVYWWWQADELFDKNEAKWHNQSKSSYHWNPQNEIFYSFENEKSVMAKMEYVKEYNFGGVFMYGASSDDDSHGTLMNVVSSFQLCSDQDKDQVNYDCS